MSQPAQLNVRPNALYKPLWQTRKRYVISIGGRGGARSYENSQKIVAHLKQTERPFRASIMRAVHADVRHSIWQECVDRVNAWELEGSVSIADSTMGMECGRNSIQAHGFRRSSHERTAKLKSLAGYTDAFIEEAEEVSEDDFRQLDDSLRAAGSQIHLMLNTPAKSHWIIKRWFDLEPVDEAPGFYRIRLKASAERDVELIFSDHSRNKHLAQEVHDRYEAYRTLKPAYYWQMIRGFCPEVVMGRIYTGWRKIDQLPHEARFLGRGLDFGFDPDPVALLGAYWHNGGIILDEELYERRVTNPELARTVKMLPSPGATIVGDSAEPKSIEELRELGVLVIPCAKGADSVNFGIKHVQSLRISYTARSKNLEHEYENYAWKRKKDQVEENDHLGMEDPACENHLMSAARYFLTEMVKANADPEAEERAGHQLERERQESLSTAQQDAGL